MFARLELIIAGSYYHAVIALLSQFSLRYTDCSSTDQLCFQIDFNDIIALSTFVKILEDIID